MSRFLEAFATTLPGFLNEFGRVVAYTPKGGTARDVVGIVSTRTETVEFETLIADGLRVWVRFVAKHVPELAQGDAVAIDAANYTVDGLEFDRGGTVMATLIRA